MAQEVKGAISWKGLGTISEKMFIANIANFADEQTQLCARKYTYFAWLCMIFVFEIP